MVWGPFRYMDKPTVDELRDLVRKRHRAVANKISRTRRVNGAELAGTAHDPRRSHENIAKYNRRQLEATLNSYNAFTSRGTQFYGDANRRPISRKTWKAYKAAETAFNTASASRFGKFADTPVPGRGMTARQYRAATRSEFPRAADPVVNDPYASYSRQPSNIDSARRLAKLTKDLNKRATPRDYENRLRDSRANAKNMLDKVGDDKMRKAVSRLSRDQFEWLWNVSPFAKSAALRYGVASAMSADRQASWMDDAMDDQVEDMWDLVNAARKIK